MAWRTTTASSGMPKGSFDVKFFYGFRTYITDGFPRDMDSVMKPVRGDIPGEEIFGKIEEAMDVLTGRKPSPVPDDELSDCNLKPALMTYGNLSGQEALVSLKHAAEQKDVNKGCTVLYGTMKYETQKDREEAFKWAKNSMNHSVKKLASIVQKKQKQKESKGR